MCWAIASPVGSSPDDDFHLASIWCGLGDRPALCESVPGHPNERAVPYGVAHVMCTPYYPLYTDKCAAFPTVSRTSLVATDRGNFIGAYPPVYYAFMSIFASPHVEASAIVMRLVNVLLFVGITSLLYFLLAPRRRRTLIWMWAIGIVPLGVFLIGSNNPSAWAIISSGSLWIALVGYFESRGRRQIYLGLVAAIVALMGAGARADSAMYAVIAVIVTGIIAADRSRRFWLTAILPEAIAIGAIAFYLASRQSAVSTSGLGSSVSSHAPAAISSLGLIVHNFMQIPSLWVGGFGTWGLGWLDTAMPAVVFVVGIMLFGALTLTGLVSNSRRKMIGIGFVLAMLTAIPAWVLLQSRAEVGQEVQPRYILPMVIMLGGIALLQVSGRTFALTRVQTGTVVLALAIANAVALFTNMARYVSSDPADTVNLNHNVSWWWAIPLSPTVVWAAGSVMFAAAVAIALGTKTVRVGPSLPIAP